MKKIYLIRHGETEWSKSLKHTGKTDLPLTKEGRDQVLSLKSRLKNIEFAQILVSPLKRARETFDLLERTEPFEISDELVEWDYGRFEGMTTKEIHQEIPDWTIFTHGAEGGESVNMVKNRAEKLLKKVLEVEGPTALFTSGHIGRMIATRFLQLEPVEARHFILTTASLSLLGYEHETPAIVFWNEIFHRS